MSAEEWFRNTSWDIEIEKAFFARLARSRTQRDQHLIIQALTLVRKHPHVALRLVETYFETAKSDFEHVRALLARAEALLELARIDDALAAMKEILSTEQQRPSHKTTMFVDYPFLVATKKLRPEYERALLTLENRANDAKFPLDHFKRHVAASLIHADRQERAQARLHAEQALLAAQIDSSPFRFHRKLGLVGEEHRAVVETLQKLARS